MMNSRNLNGHLVSALSVTLGYHAHFGNMHFLSVGNYTLSAQMPNGKRFVMFVMEVIAASQCMHVFQNLKNFICKF